MAAVRRSLFDNAERAKFLNHVVTGVKRILQQNAQVHSIALSGFWRLHYSFTISCCFFFQSLSELSNYHEFCRLLARLKTNYQLGELVMVDHYRDVIQLIAKFTVESLQVISFFVACWLVILISQTRNRFQCKRVYFFLGPKLVRFLVYECLDLHIFTVFSLLTGLRV